MRVHRTCAACSATFSSAKECPSCGSTKYKRYPPKRTEAEKIASRERRAALIKANKENAPIIPDYNYDPRKEPVLTKPSKCGGQDLVHKKPRQRVRRTCHECQSLFTTGNKTCDKCSHVRCTDCPRDPYAARYPVMPPLLILTFNIGLRRTSTPSATRATNSDPTPSPTTNAMSARRSSPAASPTAPPAQSALTKSAPTVLDSNLARSSRSQTRQSSRVCRPRSRP
jgi:hypothetical protein